MRILLVGGNHRAEIRGWTVALHGLARTLRDRGHEVTVLHAARPGDRQTLEGVRIVYHGVTRKSVFPFLFALRSLRRYDVVHANEEGGAYFALRSRVERFPFVEQLQIPHVRAEGFWKSNWRWRYIGVAARLAGVIVTPSRWLTEALARRYGMPESRFRVVPYGIGSAWFDAYREPRELARPAHVVLVNMKGVDVALRAFAKAAAGTDARLELYGVDKSLSQHEALARELGIGERARFLGFVPNPDLPARIAGADLLLHPTRGESFGQVLAEAAALGIPSISSRATAVPEVVEHGVTGLLCPVDDADAFAAALSTLIRDRELRLRMGQAARRRALELWRWDRVAARLEEEVYGPLLAERGRFASP